MEHQEKPSMLFAGKQVSEPSEELVKAICKWVALFADHFHKEISELSTMAYIEGLKDFTVEQLNAGCQGALRNCTSMVHVADIRRNALSRIIDDMDRVFDARRTEQRAEQNKQGCSACEFTGWKMVPNPAGGNWVTKCDCRRTQANPD